LIGVFVSILVGAGNFWEPLGRFVGTEGDPAAGIAGTGIRGLTDGLGPIWSVAIFAILFVALWRKANGKIKSA
jgi:hypothetical protein